MFPVAYESTVDFIRRLFTPQPLCVSSHLILRLVLRFSQLSASYLVGVLMFGSDVPTSTLPSNGAHRWAVVCHQNRPAALRREVYSHTTASQWCDISHHPLLSAVVFISTHRGRFLVRLPTITALIFCGTLSQNLSSSTAGARRAGAVGTPTFLHC